MIKITIKFQIPKKVVDTWESKYRLDIDSLKGTGTLLAKSSANVILA